MNTINNISDNELLSMLNELADKFDSGVPIDVETQRQNSNNDFDELQFSAGNNSGFSGSTYTEPFHNETYTQGKGQEVQSVNDKVWEDMEIQLQDTPNNTYGSTNSPDVEIPIINPSYTMDSSGNIVFSNIRPSQQENAFRITPERGVIPDYGNMKFLERRRKTLFESEFGMSYSYKKSWETLLHSIIARFPDAMAINIFGIRGSLIIAKKLEVDPYNFTDEKLGITLYDLIEYHTLFKMLPAIERLVLDEKATERLMLAYGDTAQSIWQVFLEAKHLKLLRIKTSAGWKDYSRDSFASTSQELDSDMAETRARAEIQYKADTINPRKSEMTTGYARRVKQNAREMRQHSFGIAKEAFMDKKPKLVKSIFYSALGLGLIAVGGVSAGIGGLQQLFKK